MRIGMHTHLNSVSNVLYTVKNLMICDTVKFITDKINVNTINKQIKTPKTSHNMLYY
jgi:hypothetical protein